MNGNAQIAGEGAEGRKTILIVDDNPVVAHFFAVVLRRAGFEVLEATSSEEAQQFADMGRHVDLLLTDYQLSCMNGIELAIWFREKQPGIPVMLMTGSAAVTAIMAAHPSFHCRVKPWDAQELTCAVTGMFGAVGR